MDPITIILLGLGSGALAIIYQSLLPGGIPAFLSSGKPSKKRLVPLRKYGKNEFRYINNLYKPGLNCPEEQTFAKKPAQAWPTQGPMGAQGPRYTSLVIRICDPKTGETYTIRRHPTQEE